jgi:hypothetical protein
LNLISQSPNDQSSEQLHQQPNNQESPHSEYDAPSPPVQDDRHYQGVTLRTNQNHEPQPTQLTSTKTKPNHHQLLPSSTNKPDNMAITLTMPNLSSLSLSSSLSTLLAKAAQQDEDQLLNGIWIGLLSVEALMVLGVAVRGLVGAVASSRRLPGRVEL